MHTVQVLSAHHHQTCCFILSHTWTSSPSVFFTLIAIFYWLPWVGFVLTESNLERDICTLCWEFFAVHESTKTACSHCSVARGHPSIWDHNHIKNCNSSLTMSSQLRCCPRLALLFYIFYKTEGFFLLNSFVFRFVSEWQNLSSQKIKTFKKYHFDCDGHLFEELLFYNSLNLFLFSHVWSNTWLYRFNIGV